jgi:hypothetical protein
MVAKKNKTVNLCPRCLGQGRIVQLKKGPGGVYCSRCQAWGAMRGAKEAVA